MAKNICPCCKSSSVTYTKTCVDSRICTCKACGEYFCYCDKVTPPKGVTEAELEKYLLLQATEKYFTYKYYDLEERVKKASIIFLVTFCIIFLFWNIDF